MPRDPIPPDVLHPRRLAARALAMALDGFELGTVARRFSPDDPTECLPGADPGEIAFGDLRARWAPVAFVYLDGSRARVVIEDIQQVIRPNPRGEVDVEELGIFSRPGRPDVDVTVDLSEMNEREGELLRTAPQRILPREFAPSRLPVVIRAVRGLRR
jgi:hypothetical protein